MKDKEQRVIEAARAWRAGWNVYPTGSRSLTSAKDLIGAIDALDAPVERYTTDGNFLYENGKCVGSVGYESDWRFAKKLVDTLNAAERGEPAGGASSSASERAGGNP